MSGTIAGLAATREAAARRKLATNDAGQVLEGLRYFQAVYGWRASGVRKAIASVEPWVMANVRKLAGWCAR